MFKARGTCACCVKVLVVFASVFLVGSCSTAPMKAYTGPERPAGETALIRPADYGIDIVSCDETRITSTVLSVLPGEHIIGMRFFDRTYEVYSKGTAFIKFQAEAGHTYIVNKTLYTAPGRFEAFIIDQMTGKRVSVPTVKP